MHTNVKCLTVYLTVYGITKKLESSISGSWRPLFESHDVGVAGAELKQRAVSPPSALCPIPLH